ncbi:MAG: TonB-dependent receptor, partial [Hyphomonadaceae bacterium]
MVEKTTFWGETLLRNFFCYGVSALALLATSTPVFAQAPTKAQDDTNQIEEVIVTAQRRSERLQNVPLAVSAVSGDQLAKLGINNPTELRFISPSVNFGNSANTRGEGLTVRGVGTQIFGDGVEQSVGVVVDGVPMGRNGMGIADMLDVDRVEVLRGPQGMLFGKNASAGVISIITRAPQLGETSLDVKGSYATKDEIKASLTANFALGEQAALRVSYGTTERDGYIFNKVRNEYLNNRDSDTLRVRFLADVNANVRVQLSADWGNSNSLCCSWTALSAPATTTFGALNAANGIVPGPTNLTNAAGAPFFQNQDYRGLTSQVDWNLGWAELTAIAGYRYWYATDANVPD